MGSFSHDTICRCPGKSDILPSVATNRHGKLDLITDKITSVFTWLPGAYQKATVLEWKEQGHHEMTLAGPSPLAHVSLGAMQASILAETSGFGSNRREEVRKNLLQRESDYCSENQPKSVHENRHEAALDAPQ